MAGGSEPRYTRERRGGLGELVHLNGETRTVAAWLKHFGLAAHTYQGRLRLGWSRQQALEEPVRKGRGGCR